MRVMQCECGLGIAVPDGATVSRCDKAWHDGREYAYVYVDGQLHHFCEVQRALEPPRRLT